MFYSRRIREALVLGALPAAARRADDPEIGLSKGIEAFDKYTLWSLNAVAVANIAQFGGRFREQPIYVGNPIPPHFKEVPTMMDPFISVVHENWDIILILASERLLAERLA